MSVVDVYELATDIGSEFERMIDAFGTEAVTKLMPKVINALELLESYAQENGNGNDDGDQIAHLKSKIAHLESEKIEKAEDRHKFEKELELMEENLQEENKNLLQLIRRLKEENRRLGTAFAEKEEPQCNHEQDLKLMQKMTVLVNRQKEQLRQQELSSNQKNAEFDSLQGQMEELKRQNRELLKMQQSARTQVISLVEEKEQLQMRCQDQEEELSSLQENLGVVCKTNEDLSKASGVPTCSNTVTYDVDDPERPRFTVRELRKILFERNDLKARVSELEDELELYRPKSGTNPSRQPERSSSPAAEDDGPVQGPINKEPDDAPWKKRDSGIRKLFRVLFGDSAGHDRTVYPRRGAAMVHYHRGPLH